ncbi:hypothetical protein CGCA056_v000915 [Colletotrichum aenigma]|uniref:uncharacterized protein n=1 Tax=Colletotrichum aenigma TaxID=1215731 RepID=UPI001872427F|nr:uncharacterized protein CGCA056_v000915 [Colletotrichum aenigma]KAF5528242.1 hypothetical protein CGCA056_v000915 [Colletotrichum aenigma]
MAPALAPDYFVGFDVSDDDKPFLLDVLAHPGTPWEEKVVVSDICLFSGFEDWYLKLECAASIRDNCPPPAPEFDARDVLAFVPRPTKAALANEELRKGWAATDQSIKNLSAMLRVHRSGLTASPQPVEKEERVIKREGGLKRERDDDATEAPRRVKQQRTAPKATSHYFAPPGHEQAQQQSASTSPAGSEQPDPSAILRHGIATPRNSPRKSNNPESANASASGPSESSSSIQTAASQANGGNDDIAGDLKGNGPQTARDLRAEKSSWPTRLSPSPSPSPTTSSGPLFPLDLSHVKSEE